MNEPESRMNDEQKAAMDEGYDMITELMEFVRDISNELVQKEAKSEVRELLNDARGVLDLMNEVIYKNL